MGFKLKNLDVNKADKILEIKKNAERDAAMDHPDSSFSGLSATENKIKNLVQTHFDNAMTEIGSDVKNLENSFGKSKRLLVADGHDVHVQELKLSSDILIDKLIRRIEKSKKELKDFKHDFQIFRFKNNLNRDPLIRTQLAKNISIFVVLFMFIFETGANASLLNGAVTGGFFGAIATAVVVSFINILCSFLLGSMSLPQLNHINKDRQKRAKFVIAIYLPVIIYFNFAMGVFRSASEIAMAENNAQAALTAAQSAVMPFNDLGDLTFTSAGLIATGLLFALVALIDGYKYDDEYPGYGAMGRKLERLKLHWEKTEETTMNEFEKNTDKSVNEINSKKEDREEACSKWSENIDTLQRWANIYDTWKLSLISSGNTLMKNYRTLNSQLRRNEPPGYFSDNISFDFEKTNDDPLISIRSLHIDDETKQTEVKQFSLVIMSEWRNASANMIIYLQEKRILLRDEISRE